MTTAATKDQAARGVRILVRDRTRAGSVLPANGLLAAKRHGRISTRSTQSLPNDCDCHASSHRFSCLKEIGNSSLSDLVWLRISSGATKGPPSKPAPNFSFTVGWRCAQRTPTNRQPTLRGKYDPSRIVGHRLGLSAKNRAETRDPPSKSAPNFRFTVGGERSEPQ